MKGDRHTDYVDCVGILGAGDADEKIIGLDVAVNEGLVMDGLDTRDLQAVCEHKSGKGGPPAKTFSRLMRSGRAWVDRHVTPNGRAPRFICSTSPVPEAKENQRRTICFAAMQTVLIVNFRPHISKRSSKLGPSRSMTRTLWRPS